MSGEPNGTTEFIPIMNYTHESTKMTKIGITGTRDGMNETQFELIHEYLDRDEKFEIHHGDCNGVDAEVACLAKELGHYIVSHPPTSSSLRAYTDYDEIREPLGYLERNRKIVESTDFLIVVPNVNEWQPRGGTWYTHDYAVKKNKIVDVLYRSGRQPVSVDSI